MRALLAAALVWTLATGAATGAATGWATRAAWAGPLSEDEVGVSEQELEARARQGRLSQEELVQKGEKLSIFTRLRLYLYAKELEPYFLGVEEAFRDLARSDPADQAAVERGRRRIYQAMARARERLLASGRPEVEDDWRRGLVGLIWLDHQWRGRVYEQGKDEIKNPYDLVALVDCLDARLRGLDTGSWTECPARAKRTHPEDETGHEQLSGRDK